MCDYYKEMVSKYEAAKYAQYAYCGEFYQFQIHHIISRRRCQHTIAHHISTAVVILFFLYVE